MSFDGIRRVLGDTEAIKNYDSLKEEKTALEDKFTQLECKMQEMKTTYEGKIQALENKLAAQSSQLIKYNKRNYTPQSFNKLVESIVDKEYKARIKSEVEAKWAVESPKLVREARAPRSNLLRLNISN
jgi:predicted nuclease with TOPRIM domain